MALQKEISIALSYATSKGYQIHPDAFAMLKGLEIDILKIVQDIIKIKIKQKGDFFIIVDDIKNIIISKEKSSSTGIDNLDSTTISSSYFDTSGLPDEYSKVILDPTSSVNTAEGVEGYTALFRSRYEKSLRILAMRPDSKRITKIASVKLKANNTKIEKSYNIKGGRIGNPSSVVAGLLMSKYLRKSGVEIEIDDDTGILTAVATTEELKKQVSMLALDQMVMLEIENNNVNNKRRSQVSVVRSITSPDIPDHIPNRSKLESFGVMISDLHVGSKYFMEIEFVKFLNWLSSSDHEIVDKIKFVCIGGDLIDGIGIFPNQDKELLEMNTEKQISHVEELLAKIPKHIKVFVIPGNHDLGRRAMPQPSIPRKNSEKLYSLENFTMLGNPAFIELNNVKILMYHGQSLDDIIATTPGLTYSKPAEAMKVLLKARHLSPIYGQRTPIAPEQEDMMVITEVPDIFHSGHVHVIDVQNYRGTLIVNSGAWQAQTNFQKTMGIMPTPAIAILVNLATLQPFQMDFNL